MKLTIFNLKGGQGKTTISLALATLYDFFVVTNDAYSPIDRVLGEKQAYHLEEGEELSDTPDDFKIIYDFGGRPDQRVIEAVKQSDFVIVPVFYKSPLDMETTINTVKEIEPYNKKIIIVCNMTKRGIFEESQKILGEFFSYPLFEVKESTAFNKMVEKRKSIKSLMEESYLFKHHYSKPLEQIEAIYTYMLKEQ